MSYTAIITEIYVSPHPNADRLQLGNVLGQQVIVGLDVRTGDHGVYFPPDGQLSDEYCTANNLYPQFDENGKRVGGGFIDPKHRRVKAQTFRGEKSFGLWMPLVSLEFTGTARPQLGMEFTELEGVPICNKYITQATSTARVGKTRNQRQAELPTFAKHHSTGQLYRELGAIHTDDTIIVTEKLHGTSHRIGKPFEVTELSGWRGWLLSKIAKTRKVYRDFGVAHGSRNVILSDDDGGYYGTHAFRYTATSHVKDLLRPGETLYGEIVGWSGPDTPIMGRVKTKGVVDGYGKEMVYTYGQEPGTASFYVYRITQGGINGEVKDLPWNELVRRCDQLGVGHVPILAMLDGDHPNLIDLLAPFTEACSVLDASHIREGVCLRIERDGNYVTTLKHKSHTFYVLEGIVKDSGAVDVEESG